MTLQELIEKACVLFKIKERDLYTKVRNVNIIYARCIIWYAMKNHLKIKASIIANNFNKTPATVSYGLRMIERERKYGNRMVAEFMDKIDNEGVTYGDKI